MTEAQNNLAAAGRMELAAIFMFGFGWLLAVLAIPAVVWFQMLQAGPSWMTSTLLWSSAIPVALGLLYALADTGRRKRERQV